MESRGIQKFEQKTNNLSVQKLISNIEEKNYPKGRKGEKTSQHFSYSVKQAKYVK